MGGDSDAIFRRSVFFSISLLERFCLTVSLFLLPPTPTPHSWAGLKDPSFRTWDDFPPFRYSVF